jgi:Ca2+-binding RTX toxin-like protein
VAVNAALTESATFKADEIADNGYFAHQSTVTGMWPNELARSHGYPLPPEFPDEANNIESLHSGSPDPFAVVGSFAGSPSHRYHVFGQDWFGTHVEVGIGRSTDENVWVVHTGYRSVPGSFLTGTVFDDVDGDGHMDAGEGLARVTIEVGGVGSTTTNAGGGYSIRVPPGSHRIKATGGGFSGTSTGRFTMAGYNVGADFVSGDPEPVIRAYGLCNGLEPTILGTEGDDVIRGTWGDDVIYAGAGNDVVNGLGGDDVICGGAGRDRIRGGGGKDIIFGGARRDRIFGGSRRDRINGGGGNDVINGGGGNDVINGRNGGDTIYGFRGKDRLDGSRGIDVINGGPQADSCINGEDLADCEA